MAFEISKDQNILQIISKDHHLGRSLSWNIQQGIKLNAPIDDMWEYVDWFWHHNLKNHFELEEHKLFGCLEADNQFLKKAQTQHRRIKRLFEKCPKDIKTLNSIEEDLNRLIRFEETVLFVELLNFVSKEQLIEIANSYPNQPIKEWEGKQFWSTKHD